MGLNAAAKRVLPPRLKQFLRLVQTLAFIRLVDRREFYALPEQEHLRRLFPYLRVDCVFDVGANSGQYAQMLRRQVGYKGRIVSFEPIPALANKVRKLAARDALWTVEEVALDETSGEAVFNVMQNDQFSSLGTPDNASVGLFREANKPASQIRVRKDTLEDAYRRLQGQFHFNRPFLKMDTQGFDVRVLSGGRSVAAEFVGLQSELAVLKIYMEAVSFKDAIEFYEQLGFELSAFVPNNAGHFPLLVEMDCIMVNKSVRGRL